MYDRWSSSLKSLSILEKIDIGNEYNEYKDEKIIRFLVWLGKKARKKYNIKISNPENKLKKWSPAKETYGGRLSSFILFQ